MTDQAHIAVDRTLCDDTQTIFTDMGLTTSAAIELFLRTVLHERTIPSVYRVPNRETAEAMRELESGGGQSAHSVAEMMRMLLEDD